MTKLGMLGGFGAPEVIILLIIGVPVFIIWLVTRKKK